MSGKYQDVGKGSMKRKPKRSERSPDFNGSVKIEGKEYWISAWERDGDDGPYLSLAFQPKMARDYPGATSNPPARHATSGSTTTGSRWNSGPAESEPEFNDDIPF